MEWNNVIDTVQKSTEVVFKRMLAMKIEGRVWEGCVSMPERHLTAMVGFAGSYGGMTAIHVTKPFARKITGLMLQMDAAVFTDEDVRDALGEITNMVAGHFKAEVVKTMQPGVGIFEQSIPSVIEGVSFDLYTVADAPTCCIQFEADGDQFFVEMALQRKA